MILVKHSFFNTFVVCGPGRRYRLLMISRHLWWSFPGEHDVRLLAVKYTAWKVSVFGDLLIRIFPHSDWIRRDTPYLSIFSPNAGKYRLEKLRIRTLSTQWYFRKKLHHLCDMILNTPLHDCLSVESSYFREKFQQFSSFCMNGNTIIC